MFIISFAQLLQLHFTPAHNTAQLLLYFVAYFLHNGGDTETDTVFRQILFYNCINSVITPAVVITRPNDPANMYTTNG